MASTNDEIFGKYKLYSGIAIGGVLLALMLDSCSGPDEEEVIAATATDNQPTATQTAAVTTDSVEKNLEPVEKLAVVDKNAPAAPARSGEEVYQAACLACHAAGVLNAPKLEPGAWDDRIGKGLDGLTQSSITGINSMPPRGGNPDVTDEELTNAISYMLKTAGYDVAALGGGKAAEQQAADTDSTDTAATEQQAADTDSTDTAATEQQATEAEDAKTAPVAPEKVAEAQQAPAQPEAPVAPQAPEPVVQQTALSGEQKYITDNNVGKQVYQNTCFTCHDVGIAQAPVVGDTDAWQQRATAGLDALYNSALNGKGQMPPKAGNASLSKEQVEAAVDFMLATAGVTAAAEPAQETAPVTEEPAEEKAATEETAPAEETKAADAEPAQEAANEKSEDTAAQQATTAAPAIDGEKIYRSLCFSCHDAGIAEAPKLGDKAAWEPRIAAGMESMYNNSINGMGVMPAKGGNPALSDEEVKAAVDWMAQQSQ